MNIELEAKEHYNWVERQSDLSADWFLIAVVYSLGQWRKGHLMLSGEIVFSIPPSEFISMLIYRIREPSQPEQLNSQSVFSDFIRLNDVISMQMNEIMWKASGTGATRILD